MNTIEYIIKNLEELGVNEFFGVPGDYNFSIVDSIEKNPNTKWIGCTNELNAGYAADGYARLRGYGALVTTYGVGELSAVNAIAGSFAENVPVVHIVGMPTTKNIEDKKLLHHNFQDVDYYRFQKIYDKVTAASVFLTRDNAKIEIDRVFKTLIKEKKPVYLAIPSDIAEMEISDRYTDFNWTSDKEALEEVVVKIADKINDSQKPVIVGDVLIKRFDAKIEFKEFISKSEIPVTNLLMGTNLIENDNEHYLGSFCGNISNPTAEKYVNESDCPIFVGVINSDLNSFGFNMLSKINNNVAIYGTYTYIDGKKYDNVKMSDVLEKLTETVEPKNILISKPEIGYEQVFAYNAPIKSRYIYPRMQQFIKENDIIIAETGIIPYAIGQIKFPQNADVEVQTLWGAIGWATPAVLGASLAKPNARVVLITGEGAHQISAMEIGTMLRLVLRPIIIVLNNGGYTTERLISSDSNAEYHDVCKINYAKFARIFDGDIWATKVLTEEDFDKALKVTQIMNKMCYIEVSVDKMDAPEITKNLIDFLGKDEKTQPVAVHNTERISYSLSDESFKYETVVHQAIDKDLSKEEE